MENLRKGSLTWWTVAVAVVLVMMLPCAVCQPPQLFKVGGRDGWTKDVNYTEWAIHQRLYVGDWLLFVFDKHTYNVLEVNDTNYNNCNDQNFITNITRGGRDVFNLTQARPYYFLSSGSYCFQGMKLAIHVEVYVPPPVPVPAPKKSGSINAGSKIFLTIALEIALLWAFLSSLY
ncbi:early nodulin-like protein 20 [Actinidia eriantha]|uniref:early nodulin-like protein 20 n=1 Tax=Actinidia eriantha TaxID=165200 RepID=UPI00258958F9|nr:early nodulin-like protein 20 [Actinidia eriantha]XP_057481382.1 early nodulin-like protein 20 [Actinidia eriantha]